MTITPADDLGSRYHDCVNDSLLTTVLSASVSVLGVCASVYLARRSTRAAIAGARLNTALRLKEGNIGSLKRYAAAVERVRIACWRIRRLSAYASEGGVTHAEIDKLLSDTNSLETAIKQFYLAEHALEESWADAKVEIPIDALDYVRLIRHRYANDMDTLLHMLGLLKLQQADVEREELGRTVVKIDDAANDVLKHLDELSRTILTMIWSVVNEVEEPLP